MELVPLSVLVPSKVIWAGEHAVVRGGRAIVAPCSDFSLKLTYFPDPEVLDLDSTLQALMQKLLRRLKVPPLEGGFRVESTIPEAAGLGSSAALSVALVKLLDALQISGRNKSEQELWAEATACENEFHGTSSGLDPIGVLSKGPVLFQRDQGALEHFELPSHLELRLIDSGLRAKTNEVIQKVSSRFQENPQTLSEIDQKMDLSVGQLMDGFRAQGQSLATGLIQGAFDLAHQCFLEYGLLNRELEEKRAQILNEGALSVKLTGKGLGGYWIALFPKST
jgi:mevalonate kinase